MNKGDFMAERKQVPIFESCYKIAEYLKKNTDKDHPTTQAAMRKDNSVADFLGAKETSNSYINQIALALNSGEDGALAKEKDWKVVFDAFTEVHGSKKKKSADVEYTNIEIERIDYISDENKNLIIKVVDENLIAKTGGIIQGMSGSPIIQNGKLIGAVTHVFLNDPTGGYGIFAETMLDVADGLNELKLAS